LSNGSYAPSYRCAPPQGTRPHSPGKTTAHDRRAPVRTRRPGGRTSPPVPAGSTPSGASVYGMPADTRRPPAHRVRAALLATACAALAAGCAGSAPPPVGEDGVARSTTNIAGAPVLGFDHDPSAACGPRAPLDDDADAALDARRIAVVGDGALDTLCALGLQDRVVAIA